MKNANQTTQTTKAAKAAPKAAPKAAQKAAPKAEAQTTKAAPFFATLYGMMIAGALGKAAQTFYKRADAYHAKAGTKFPRDRNTAAREALTGEAIKAVIKQAVSGNLPAGSMDGQAVYDAMRITADHKEGAQIIAALQAVAK